MVNDYANIWINKREPFDKNTLWIYPNKNDLELKVFNKGWKVLFTTKDIGLSLNSRKEVQSLVDNILNVIDKQSKHINSDLILLQNKNKQLEKRISDLERKLNKLIQING